MSRAFFGSRWSRSRALIGVAALAVAFSTAYMSLRGAELTDPRGRDHVVAVQVARELKDEHLTRHPLDAQMSERCLHNFLKALDPTKLYFTQADVDAFDRSKNDLCNQIGKGDINFAYMVFKTLLARVDDDVKVVDGLLAQDLDFKAEESMQTDPKAMTYAKDAQEIKDRWRKRIKYDLLVQKLDKTGDVEAHEKLTRRYHGFAKRMHQIDSDELLEMYLTALTTGFDPHTDYMSPSSYENFEIQMRLQLDGIGASLQFEDGYTKVNKLIPGGAAEKDGRLKPEDRVIGVGQNQAGEVVDTVDMSLNDVVKLIRGKKGTIVRLKVIPAGQTESKVYDITRASIELKDSEARGQVIEDGHKADGSPYRVGVIDLPSFYMDMAGAREGIAEFRSTTRDVKRILADFNSKKVDAVMLDLRRNGGGSLDEAIRLTGLFIDVGPVVQVKDADGEVHHLDDTEKGMSWDGPLVVLTSKFSGSASEILAGAIQDYHRGLIVGDETTHGKGTVQSMMEIGRTLHLPTANLGAIKITMQQFYRPNGDSTQNRGVLADVVLPSITSHLDVGEKDLDNALAFSQVKPANYAALNLVNDSTIRELRNLSKDRIEKSDDFKKLNENIVRYEEHKKKPVSLNEAEFMKERAQSDSDKAEEKELKELDDPNRPVVKRDYYFNEMLAVTLDYVRLGHFSVAAK